VITTDINRYVYILRCADNSFYVGIAPNVIKRVMLHNLGKGANHTKNHRPVVLVYSKQYPNKSEARKREIQIKNWTREKKEKLISGEYK
jgi:putative endonuclease